MVVYDPLLHIQKVQVLIYREDYGYEIKSRRWLQQFTKRKVDSVQAISGATISVNSLKNAVDRLNEKMASQLL
jgi:benzoyl-CoA reductase/2-hydroxyglutaryl-CoA dehydratase subunit BcrC/BadD/HgdB